MEIRHPNVAVRDLGNRQREVNYWQVLQLEKLAITIDALHSWTPKFTLLFVHTYFMSWFSVFIVNWPFLETENGSWLALISLSNQTPGGWSALKVIIKPCQVLLSDSGIAFRKNSSLHWNLQLPCIPTSIGMWSRLDSTSVCQCTCIHDGLAHPHPTHWCSAPTCMPFTRLPYSSSLSETGHQHIQYYAHFRHKKVIPQHCLSGIMPYHHSPSAGTFFFNWRKKHPLLI